VRGLIRLLELAAFLILVWLAISALRPYERRAMAIPSFIGRSVSPLATASPE
jgi:hypothetical protein